MGPQNALESTGFMLVSGNQELIGKLEPALSVMTGKLINFGTEEGRAAGMKLIGNNFLVTFTAGLADTLALAKALHIPSEEVQAWFEKWSPVTMLPARLKRMISADYSNPSWELNMARKDTGLFMKAADAAGIPLQVIPTIAAEMDRWIEKGYGDSDWTVIAKDSL
jgi:3-hydroxyisobutyrate dehydrogenase